MRHLSVLTGIIAGAAAAIAAAHAQDHVLTIRDHRFDPPEIRVPANKRVQLTVVNDDATPEEFESHELKVEKIIPGKSRAIVNIGPLDPGRYPFFGEFHEDSARGAVVAE